MENFFYINTDNSIVELNNLTEDQLEKYKLIFQSDPNIKFIELGTFRVSKYDTPYSPEKYSKDDETGEISLISGVTKVSFKELPLLTYIDRNFNIYMPTAINYDYAVKSSTEIDYKGLFADKRVKFIEIGTGRRCYHDVPFNPDKFRYEGSYVKCNVDTKIVSADDLPLLHYYSRDMVEHVVTDISGMFKECKELKFVDASKWNVSKVTSMRELFYNCQKLQSLDVSKWDTGNVTTMNHMFSNCYELENLDVSKWKVSNVTSMFNMFNNCKNLATLDVSEWQTYNVYDMSYMFAYCQKLRKLDLSGWSVYKVTNMSYMFTCCRLIEELDLSNWNTMNLTNTSYMFNECILLKELDISKWKTTKLIQNRTQSNDNMQDMFKNCPAPRPNWI